MKKTAGRMFIRGFVRSFFIIMILFSVGALGYMATVYFWRSPKEDAIEAYQKEPDSASISLASVDDVSKNLIYCYNEETHEIVKMVLEIFHCKDKKMTYITIPVRTQFTMSNNLYKNMILVNPEIPQVMKLSTMPKYLEPEVIFDYGVLIVEDMLGIDISYYTAIPQTTYETMFSEKGQRKSDSEDISTDKLLPIETLSDDFMKQVKKLNTSEKLADYITEIYPSFQSNLSLQDKLKYLDCYMETDKSSITFEMIQGNNKNSAYFIDYGLAAIRLEELMAEDG